MSSSLRASSLRGLHVQPGERLLEARSRRGELVGEGRLVELSAGPASARTSVAAALLREAQSRGDPVAWVLPKDPEGGGLFPPDLAAAGIDLDALVVVHVPAADSSAGPRAAELVLRTGAFGAVVLDLGSSVPKGSAWQGRLVGLAREHASRVLVLSPRRREEPSLGPLVSVRLDVQRARVGAARFRLDAHVIKDKSGFYAQVEPRLDDDVRPGPPGVHFRFEAGARDASARAPRPKVAERPLALTKPPF